MSIHLIVCIKSVVKSAPRGIARRTPENSELNPFDRPAIEAALQIKQAQGGRLTALSMGPAVAAESLAEALAMGADRAVLVSDRALAESDTIVTARVLAAAIATLGRFDLVLFGPRTADSDTGQIGPQTAALLNVPFVSRIKSITATTNGWDVTRTMDMWEERWQIGAPAAATVDSRKFSPRPVSLGAISAVYGASAVEQWGLQELKMKPGDVGIAGSPTRVAALAAIKRGRSCRMLEGDPQDQVDALMQRLTLAGLID